MNFITVKVGRKKYDVSIAQHGLVAVNMDGQILGRSKIMKLMFELQKKAQNQAPY